jgi:hypothetical protein
MKLQFLWVGEHSMKWYDIIFIEKKIFQDGNIETKLKINPYFIGIGIIILVVIIALI